jgi:hypothetical protein
MSRMSEAARVREKENLCRRDEDSIVNHDEDLESPSVESFPGPRCKIILE